VNGAFRPLVVRAFELAIRPYRWLSLRGPLVAGPRGDIPPDRPLLLVSNHTSWWDGFLVRDLQRMLRPESRLFTLMTERELRRHPYLRLMGCVGLEPARAGSVLAAFRRLRDERRRDAHTVFAFFPQGAIWPANRRPLGFARGVSVLARVLAPLTLLPAGIRIEPLNRAAPTAFLSLGQPLDHEGGPADTRLLEAAVEAELDAIGQHLEEFGEAAPRAWPPQAPTPQTAGSRHDERETR
jgi:1-acyl-sn-glycerol-3-phosphate acyltransferase